MAAGLQSAPRAEQAGATLAELAPEYAAANLANGRRLWSRCRDCHGLTGAQPPLPGPPLDNILGRQVGSHPGFEYSEALRTADFIWTVDRLDAWLASPDTFLPGAAMSFAGVSYPDDRRDLIAYIVSGPDSGEALEE